MSFLSLGEWRSREYRATGVRLSKRRLHRCWVDQALSLGTQIRGLNMTPAAGIALSADARRPPFDNVTIFLHWVTVLIVLAMFTSAWLPSQSQDVAFTLVLLQTHRSLGVTIWFTTGVPVCLAANERGAAVFSGRHDGGTSDSCPME
jgi:hypothetical protein